MSKFPDMGTVTSVPAPMNYSLLCRPRGSGTLVTVPELAKY